MGLAAVKTWNAGDVLTAADLNALNTNLLNNPITLISPTTGAINFQTSVAHTNLTPSAITASSGAAGSLLIASTASASVAIYSTGVAFVSTSKTLQAQRLGALTLGTALTSNNLTISSGWGSTAVISSIRGTDQAYTFQILTGSTMAANPTITTTFADGLWTTPIIGITTLTGGTGSAIFPIFMSLNTSGEVITPLFTPSTGTAYIFTVLNMG